METAKLKTYIEYLAGVSPKAISMLLESVDGTDLNNALKLLTEGILKNDTYIFYGTIWCSLHMNLYYPERFSNHQSLITENKFFQYAQKYHLITVEHIRAEDIIHARINLIINKRDLIREILSKLTILKLVILFCRKANILSTFKYKNHLNQLEIFIEDKIKNLIPCLVGGGEKSINSANQKATSEHQYYHRCVVSSLFYECGFIEILKFARENNIYEFSQLSKKQILCLAKAIMKEHLLVIAKYREKKKSSYSPSALYINKVTKKIHTEEMLNPHTNKYAKNPEEIIYITSTRKYKKIKEFIEEYFNFTVKHIIQVNKYKVIPPKNKIIQK